jgi:hypothetical protein
VTSADEICALSIEFNGLGPFVLPTRRNGFTLVLDGDGPTLELVVTVEAAPGEPPPSHHVLEGIRPGDRLRISYVRTTAHRSSIDALPQCSRVGESYQLPEGLRLGLDTQDPKGDSVRLSHPPGGGFSFCMSNLPGDHARCFVVAENDEESWRWQFRDLYLGGSIDFTVVETGWNTAFPHVVPLKSLS